MTLPVRMSPILAGAAALAIVSACAGLDENVSRLEANVKTVTVGEPYALPASTLAAAMLQAGFSPAQVLDYGPKVRNAIGTSGGAQINDGKMATAILSVQDGNLYVTSREGGTFFKSL